MIVSKIVAIKYFNPVSSRCQCHQVTRRSYLVVSGPASRKCVIERTKRSTLCSIKVYVIMVVVIVVVVVVVCTVQTVQVKSEWKNKESKTFQKSLTLYWLYERSRVSSIDQLDYTITRQMIKLKPPKSKRK